MPRFLQVLNNFRNNIYAEIALIIFIHGLIHFMGFAKAFGYGNITQLTKNISKPEGVIWFITAILFIVTAVMYLFNKDWWPVVGIIAAIISQVLIITAWKDAKFGTIANLIILLVAIGSWASMHFESQFRKDVKAHLLQTNKIQCDLLTEADIKLLPQLVQKYLQ